MTTPNLTAAFAGCGAIASMPSSAIAGSPIFLNIFFILHFIRRGTGKEACK